jgi:hypothetical protein
LSLAEYVFYLPILITARIQRRAYGQDHRIKLVLKGMLRFAIAMRRVPLPAAVRPTNSLVGRTECRWSPKRSYTQDNQIFSNLFLSLIWDYDDSVLSEIPSAWSS